jgi:hypothetical protein
MITSTIYLKNNQIRSQVKILALLCLVLLGGMLWNARNTQQEVKLAKATINRHQGLQNQFIQLSLLTKDSVFNTVTDSAQLGVFQDWIALAYWLENNRKMAQKLEINYFYDIDTLITHPDGMERTFEVNVHYKNEHPTQSFTGLIKQIYLNLNDTTKNLFIKELIVFADSNGVKNSSSTLGAWIQP